jgi:hypothetical protein
MTSWLFGVSNPKLKVLFNVMIIVFGVALASFGEIKFVWLGFFYQAGGIVFEAIRLVMIQMLLSGEGQNMDPLVSLYYYAPVCAVMNFIVAAATELSSFQIADVWRVGVFVLLLNAAVAFLLNVASVFLVCAQSKPHFTNCLQPPDWQDLGVSNDLMRSTKEHPPRSSIRSLLGDNHHGLTGNRIWHRASGTCVLWRGL